MKVTLTFDLDSAVLAFDEQRRLDLVLRAEAMHALLCDLGERLRTRADHGGLSEDAAYEIDNLRDWLSDEMQERLIPWE
jgi:hypothetical protein